ncbi:glycoside hydrolase [Colletotrichum tofieldiae]|nr:glycoside hydrolase [Colletotrichum tofieldiae]
MYAKKALSVVASLALAEQALGFNAHRHMHEDKLHPDHHLHFHRRGPDPYHGHRRSQHHSPHFGCPKASSQAPVIEQAAVALASTPASSANVATASSSSVSTGGKRGIAYNDPTKVNAFFSGACKECSWAYNWDSSDNGLSVSGADFVPMLWGPIDIHTARWTENADAAISKGSTHILSFNECDMPSQCNLDAGSAAAAHVKYVNPYAGKVKIGAPAITNSNIAGQGLDWLKSWVSACDTAGCSYDFCSVNEICGGKPVWLTEFAPFGSSEQITSFVQTNIPKLDSLEYLERYSYFMASDGVLNSGSGLSALGQAYASA